MTRTIHLSALDISVLSGKDFFRDDGFVSDMEKHTKKVYAEFARCFKSLTSYDEVTKGILMASVNGLNLEFQVGVLTWRIIYYKHLPEESLELFSRAHEETHVLHGMGRTDILQERLAVQGVDIDLQKYNYGGCSKAERDFVAHVGGLYALMANGYDVSKFTAEDEQFYAASKFFES